MKILLHDNLRDWLIFQIRAAGFTASHHDIPQHSVGDDSDGRGKQGDIIMNGRGSIFGDDTVIDISRPHTHTGEGHPKPTALQTAARAKYTKHHRGYQALGIGFFPFIVDTMGRLHDDALRTIWHLASRQIARNYARRGWQTGGRHLRDYQRDCARRARFLALECAMCEAAAGVRQRLPLAASRGIPHDGGHFTQSRGEGRTARRQWAFHDPEVGTGFDLGGG